MEDDAQSVYCYPGTLVLRNRLGIEPRSTAPGDQEEAFKRLSAEERRWSAVGLMALRVSPIRGDFDLAHLSHIHRALVGQVYEWAGAPRVENISKKGSSFAPHQYIPAYLEQLRDGLKRDDYLRSAATREEFCDRTATYLSRLNYVHPFREVNGRTMREFVRELGQKAGYEISWKNVDARLWNAAFVAAFPDDNGKFGPSSAISVELERYVVNPTPDKALRAAYEAEKPIAGPSVWRASLPDAILEAQRRANGPTAFVSAEWQHHAHPRVSSAQDVLSMLADAETHWPADLNRDAGPRSAIFTVTEAGHVRNTVTGRDEYLRVGPDSRNVPPQLAAAMEEHFRQRSEHHEAPARPPEPSLDI